MAEGAFTLSYAAAGPSRRSGLPGGGWGWQLKIYPQIAQMKQIFYGVPPVRRRQRRRRLCGGDGAPPSGARRVHPEGVGHKRWRGGVMSRPCRAESYQDDSSRGVAPGWYVRPFQGILWMAPEAQRIRRHS